MMRGLALIGLAVAVAVLVPGAGILLVAGLAAWIFVTRSSALFDDQAGAEDPATPQEGDGQSVLSS